MRDKQAGCWQAEGEEEREDKGVRQTHARTHTLYIFTVHTVYFTIYKKDVYCTLSPTYLVSPEGFLALHCLLRLLEVVQQQVVWKVTAKLSLMIPVHYFSNLCSCGSSCPSVLEDKNANLQDSQRKGHATTVFGADGGGKRSIPKCILLRPLWCGINMGSRSTSETIMGSIR